MKDLDDYVELMRSSVIPKRPDHDRPIDNGWQAWDDPAWKPRQQPRGIILPPTPDEAPAAALQIVPSAEFLDEHEELPDPLLGTKDEAVLPVGGWALAYGKGGSTKTTMLVDLLAHMGAGIDWLGLPVPRPVRIVVIEDEGPRAYFRQKLARKAEGWEGPDFLENVHVLREPWALFTLMNERHRGELRAYCRDQAIDCVVAGPLKRLGAQGAGTLDETNGFELMLRDVGLGHEEHPVAFWIAHHDNRAGTVSGAWEGVPDVLMHVSLDGRERTKVHWEKVRWSSRLHDRTWIVRWAGGDGFELVDTGEQTREEKAVAARVEAAEWMRGYLERVPDASKNKAVEAYKEAHAGKGREAARHAYDQVRGEQTAHPAHRGFQPPVEEGARVRALPEGEARPAAHPSEGSDQVRGEVRAHLDEAAYWEAREIELFGGDGDV